MEVLDLTFEELRDQGYLTAFPLGTPVPKEGEDLSSLRYSWEDGCLFSITPSEDHEGESYSLPTLFFDAEKWRSPWGPISSQTPPASGRRLEPGAGIP